MIASREELAAAFTAARSLLSETNTYDRRDRREYICHCLELAQAQRFIPARVSVEARQVIRERLNAGSGWASFNSLQSWITHHHPELMDEVFNDRFWDRKGCKMQATRMAWLNSLIAEFSQPA